MPQITRPLRVLLAFPQYTPSFGTFQYAYPIMGVKAFMPPQGLLVIAAALPRHWELRFVDENVRPARTADFDWCDVVFVSGMHIQREQINDLCNRAHARGKPTVLGGPSVSACPHYYPDFDYLHVGEMGDATDTLIETLERDRARPAAQVILTTVVRRDLTDFPLPAYELCDLPNYFMGSIQFSSGCPYDCEFCDIPALYGRNPRLKSPEQVIAELDKMRACGLADAVYFVDDNFIGNRRAVRELLPVLIDWQKRHDYPLTLACEATLNIAKRPEILEQMREAKFETIFCGIETPEPEALKAMSKEHNMMVPLFEAIDTLNGYGMEVVSGIIMGLDTDTLDTGEGVVAFVERSQIPVLTINLLQALPRTKLWDRLAAEGRLVDDEGRES
ncbi:MAG: B12-binding domain-containing radical SAM protein, partial [Caulobacteraceae bacterium]